jgi:hypothetical protein
MKKISLTTLVACLAALSLAADNGKTISVEPSMFSAVYPAVWFSPSTGEITPLKERSERPPAEQYEIWIEPGDPELRIRGEGVGFALIGKGKEAFRNPSIPDDLPLKGILTRLMEEAQATDQLVFFCKAKDSACVIMVTAMDSKEEVLQFTWRLLTSDIR